MSKITLTGDFITVESLTRYIRRVHWVFLEHDKPSEKGIERELWIKTQSFTN